MQSAVSPLTVSDLRGGPLGICRAFVSCCFSHALLLVDLCGSIALVSESLRILARSRFLTPEIRWTPETLVIASRQSTMPCLLCRSPRKFLWNRCQHHRNLAWLQQPCLLHLLFRPRLLPFWLPSPTPSSKCFRPSKLQAFLLGVYPQGWPTPEAFQPHLLIWANLLPKRHRSPLLAMALHPPYRPRWLLLLQVGQITVLFLLLYWHFPLLFHRSLSRLFPAISTRPFPQAPLAPHRLLHCRFYINRSCWALVFLLYRQN